MNTGALYRSTTPTIIMKINDEEFDMTEIEVCHLTIENDSGRNRKIFPNPEISLEDRTIIQTLTQDEMNSFETGTLYLQLKIRLINGTVIASKIVSTTLQKILEEEPL